MRLTTILKALFVSGLLCYSFFCYANEAQINGCLKTFQVKSKQTDCLIELGKLAEDSSNFKGAEIYYQNAYKLSDENNWDKKYFIIESLVYVSLQQKNYDQAISWGYKLLELTKQTNNTKKRARAHNNLGQIHYKTQNYASAIEHYKKAIETFGSNDSIEFGISALNLGTVYMDVGFDNESMRFLHIAAKTLKSKNLKKPLAASYNALGNLHKNLKNYSQAQQYHQMALELRTDLKHRRGIAASYNNLGHLYKDQSNTSKALTYYKKALQIKNSLNDPLFKASTTNSIGELYLQLNKTDSAKLHLNLSYKLRNQYGDSAGALHSLNSLVSLYLQKRQLELAERGINRCLQLQANLNNPTQYLEIVESQIRYYELKQYEDSVIYYLKKAKVLRDSIFLIDKHKALLQLETHFNVEQKNNEIDWLKTVKNEQNKQLDLRKRLLYLSLFTLLFISGLGSLIYKQYKTQKKLKMQVENLIKDLHHRVKNNLQQLSSLLSLQLNATKDKTAREALKTGKVRVIAMNLLHQQLNNNSAASHLKLQDYLHNLIANIEEIYGLYNCVEFGINDESISISHDKAVSIGLIVSELVTNSVKYVKNQKLKAKLKITSVNNNLTLIYGDSGNGFEWDKKKESSFGLRLVQLQVKQLEGKLSYCNQRFEQYKIVFEIK